jgi:hypothetical protein
VTLIQTWFEGSVKADDRVSFFVAARISDGRVAGSIAKPARSFTRWPRPKAAMMVLPLMTLVTAKRASIACP